MGGKTKVVLRCTHRHRQSFTTTHCGRCLKAGRRLEGYKAADTLRKLSLWSTWPWGVKVETKDAECHSGICVLRFQWPLGAGGRWVVFQG